MLNLNNLGRAERVFQYFEEISKIPHGSGNTDCIADYLVAFAKEHSLEYGRDGWNNVIIKKRATAGFEDRPAVILQGHTDMVAEKCSECDIDMRTEGLKIYAEGDYITADGTTLGGDDGIAVAYMLAILESDNLPHPAIEALFTSDEEIGLIGAGKIDPNWLSGKTLINIDSEDEGVFTVGCAGGVRIDMPISKANCEMRGGRLLSLKISGLLGGHSGVEINKGRANAAKIAGLILNSLDGVRIARICGGNMDNAIMRECEALFECNSTRDETLAKIAPVLADIKNAYSDTDPDISVELYESEETCRLFSKQDSADILGLLNAIPAGVIKMSAEIEGLPETSANVGVIRIDATGNGSYITASLRSSKASELVAFKGKYAEFCRRFGAGCEFRGEYPAWEYRQDSRLRDTAVTLYRELYGSEPVVMTIHAGLECGVLSQKIEGLDCISIGPDMRDIHTTEERLSISSSVRVYEFILELIKRL